MMGQVIIDAAGTPFNADQWDGYQASRGRFLQTLAANQINNVAVLTGDIHSSWGNEITANPFLPTGYTPQAVEFVTTAVTSPAFEDPAVAAATAAGLLAVHPHIKYLDLNRRGYLLMDIDRNRVQGEWFFVDTITERRAGESFARALACASGSNRLTVQTSASTPRANAAPLVP
jgi:alkaline phosphatase D